MATRAGLFQVECKQDKITALKFPGQGKSRRAAASVDGETRQIARKLTVELNEYFSNRRTRFSVPLELSAGTSFQQKVWRALRRIPHGATQTYGEIARAIGSPRSFRAVGAACGQNPMPILIPCHRVVAGNGKLGGFSGGLEWKRRLLALEGARSGRG